MNVSDDDNGPASTTLDVLVGLELTITKRNLTHSLVRWPGAFTGFAPQRASALPGGPNWATIAEPPELVGGQWQVLVPHPNGHAFFRLVKP